MTNVFFSTGYLGEHRLLKLDKPLGKIRVFDRMVSESGLIVIDTRMNPYSRAECWRGAEMKKRLPARYLHVPDWGNVNYRNGGQIQVKDFYGGLLTVQAYLKLQDPKAIPLLLCGCEYADGCHRSVLAESLRSEGWKGADLQIWGRISLPPSTDDFSIHALQVGEPR